MIFGKEIVDFELFMKNFGFQIGHCQPYSAHKEARNDWDRSEDIERLPVSIILRFCIKFMLILLRFEVLFLE